MTLFFPRKNRAILLNFWIKESEKEKGKRYIISTPIPISFFFFSSERDFAFDYPRSAVEYGVCALSDSRDFVAFGSVPP